MRMPSDSRTKNKLPPQLVAESSTAESIVITVDATNPNEPMATGKEAAGKPLYLKRV